MARANLPDDPTFRNLAVTGEVFLGGYGTVTQITSITTGVTLSTKRGAITTFDPALAAAGEATFTVTNTTVNLTSNVIVSVRTNVTAGGPVLAFVSAITAGTFNITLTNLHATTQADTAMVINFVVI